MSKKRGAQRAALRRGKRDERKPGISVEQDGGTAFVAPGDGLTDREKLEFAAALASAGFENGTPVIVQGETVTPEHRKTIESFLDGIPVGHTGPLEFPEELGWLTSEPRPPQDATQAWPQDVAAHDQAAAALLDFMTEDDEPTTTAAVSALKRIAKRMPSHATVAVVVEFADGHCVATLLNPDGRNPSVTMLYYGDDDPKRLKDAAGADVMHLSERAP